MSFIEHSCHYEGDIDKGQANGQGIFTHDEDKYTFDGDWEYSKPKSGKVTFSGNTTVIEVQNFEKMNAKVIYPDHKIYHGQLDPKTFVPHGVG